MILIGYSGHAFVVYGILNSSGQHVTGYCETEEKKFNPFNLKYYGPEKSEAALEALCKNDLFISVGDNKIRKSIYDFLNSIQRLPINAIHPSAIIAPGVKISPNGVMISAGVIINPLCQIGSGAICNTGCIIEHECMIGDFSHIAPGAIVCGNTHIGEKTFVGAGAVIRQGITVGSNVMIGAGSVVVKDVPDNATVMGCPAK